MTARIGDQAQQVFDDYLPSLPDAQARPMAAYCSLVLATFRDVRAATNDEAQAYELTRAVLQQSLKRLWQSGTQTWLWWVRDTVGFLKRRKLARTFQRNAGASMEFAEEKSDEAVTLIVRRCGFHQFFADHGEPALTPVICALDRLWMDALDASSRPVRTERPATISTGGDCCCFRFVRDEKKHNREAADIVLVQLQKAPYKKL